MKKLLLHLFLCFSFLCFGKKTQNDLKLWFDSPASIWEETLLVGNGRIGGAIFGNPLNELIQLNEETLWSGYPKEENNPKAASALAKIRKAVDNEDYLLASQLWKENSQGPYTARYLPMADLKLNMKTGKEKVANYFRDLNLSNACATVEFESNGVKYKRTVFVSYPDQVMVVKLESNKRNSISMDISLSSQLRHKTSATKNNLTLKGKAPSYVAHRKYEPNQIVYDEKGEGINFEVQAKLLLDGGKSHSSKDGKIGIKNANSVVIILSAATSFNGIDKSPGFEGKNQSKIARQFLDKAQTKSYETLLKNHTNDYKSLFNRVQISLGRNSSKLDHIPTDQRLINLMKDDSDTGLFELYYQLGRYLVISSSRPGGIPSNLQGIWNYHVQPPWGSNYTTNINTEMNYLPVESTNLQECHQPLFDFIKLLSIKGEKTAKVNYGINRGWVSHHNSDLWAQTAPTGGYEIDSVGSTSYTCWNMSGPWFCQHLWEHYTYNGDINFLQDTAYPLMKGAALFFLDYLTVDEKNGFLVTSPSTSPENQFLYFDKNGEKQVGNISKASTMDMMLLWELFSNCIQAAKILNVDYSFSQELEAAKNKLYPLHVGKLGNLQEWDKDFEDEIPTHRHLSHLYGLYPGSQIIPRNNPDIAAACKRSLEIRGDGTMGWAMVWKAALYARLEESNKAFQMIKDALKHETSTVPSVTSGGTYINLLNAAPFQIDANFGGTAAITEMLIQDNGGEIFLLPALPDKWSDGFVKGIRCKGGFTVDIEWKNGKLFKLTVHSSLGGNCRIRSRESLFSSVFDTREAMNNNPNPYYYTTGTLEIVQNYNNQALKKLNFFPTYLIDFATKKGTSYELIVKN